MFVAAEELKFEHAARLRDEIADLRRELLERSGDGPAADARPRGTTPVPRRSGRRSSSTGGRRR